MPPRKRGSDYHSDGPYIGRQTITRQSSLDFSQKLSMSFIKDKPPNSSTLSNSKLRGPQSMIFSSFNSSMIKNSNENFGSYQLNRIESPLNVSMRRVLVNKNSAINYFDVSKLVDSQLNQSMSKSNLAEFG